MRILLISKWFLIIAVIFFLSACSDKKKMGEDLNTIRVGVMMGGAEEKLIEAVQKVAQKQYDLKIKIVPYTYAQELNKALSNREIDTNVFQYRAYLEYSEKKHGYHFSNIGDTYIYPMGVYSDKVGNILELKENAVIAIPNEPTNEARALFLLEKAGLIRLKSDDVNSTVDDIIANPNNFKFKILPANHLVNVLPHVDAIVVNAGFALSAGLIPSQHALVIENENSAYANVVVVREGEENEPRMKAFVEILHSADIQEAVNQIFKGQAIPAWK